MYNTSGTYRAYGAAEGGGIAVPRVYVVVVNRPLRRLLVRAQLAHPVAPRLRTILVVGGGSRGSVFGKDERPSGR